MKRSARNIIQQIEVNDKGFDVYSFSEKILAPESYKEEVLLQVIAICEKRKKDYSIPLYRVVADNNFDLRNVMGLGIPAIDILSLCGLLMSCIRELDTELISVKGELDQLQAKKGCETKGVEHIALKQENFNY